MYEYYKKAGIKEEKLRWTGSLSDDVLFHILQHRDQKRSELETRLPKRLRKKIVLVALPPNQFASGHRKGVEFRDYDSLIRFMLSTLTRFCGKDHTILANPHPRLDVSSIAWIESMGVSIVAEPIESLVPLADLYVAVASATIRLAMSCGVPTINFDAFHYYYNDYTDTPGICEVRSCKDYEAIVEKLMLDRDFFQTLQKHQRDNAERLYTIDGQAGSRMLALFDALVAHREATSGEQIVSASTADANLDEFSDACV